MQSNRNRYKDIENLLFKDDFDVVESLSTLDGARETVDKLKEVEKLVEDLVHMAEDDLLSYYDPIHKYFNRLPEPHIGPDPENGVSRTSMVSNACAAIALQQNPTTGKLWDHVRDHVVDRLQKDPRHNRALQRGSIFINAQIAVALEMCGMEYPETVEPHEAGTRFNKLEWPIRMNQNLKRYLGGAAVNALLPEPVVHPWTTYWVVRSLQAYREVIRGIDPKVDTRIRRATDYASLQVYSLWPLKERKDCDVVAFSFALATYWLSAEKQGVFDGLDLTTREVLDVVMSKQMEDGTWKTGCPLFAIDSRSYAYPFPHDIFYGLYQDMDRRLMDRKVRPEEILTPLQLNAILRFVKWAHKNRFTYKEATCEPKEPSPYRGWHSSAEPGAKYPESWATSVVLRAAKAILTTLREAMGRMAAVTLDPSAVLNDPIEWEDVIQSERVKSYFESYFLGKKQADTTAILAGPAGTGKTFFSKNLAGALAKRDDTDPLFVSISPDRILGQAEGQDVHVTLNRIFTILKMMNRGLVLLDEIDELVRERDGVADEAASRMTTTFMLPILQELKSKSKLSCLVGTNHIENFDAAIRREGRFDAIVAIEPPDKNARRDHFFSQLFSTLIEENPESAEYFLFEEMDNLKSVIGPITRNKQWAKRLDQMQRFDGVLFAFRDVMAELFRQSTASHKTTRNALQPLVGALRDVSDLYPETRHEIDSLFEKMTLWEDAAYFYQEHLVGTWWMAAFIFYHHKSLTTEQCIGRFMHHLGVLKEQVRRYPHKPYIAVVERVKLLCELIETITEKIAADPRFQVVKLIPSSEPQVLDTEFKDKFEKRKRDLKTSTTCLERFRKLLSSRSPQPRPYLVVEFSEDPYEIQQELFARSDWSMPDGIENEQMRRYLRSEPFKTLVNQHRSARQKRQRITENELALLEAELNAQTKTLAEQQASISSYRDEWRKDGAVLKEIADELQGIEQRIHTAMKRKLDLVPLEKEVLDQFKRVEQLTQPFLKGKSNSSSLDQAMQALDQYWAKTLLVLADDLYRRFKNLSEGFSSFLDTIPSIKPLQTEDKHIYANAVSQALDKMKRSFDTWWLRTKEVETLIASHRDEMPANGVRFKKPVYLEQREMLKSKYKTGSGDPKPLVSQIQQENNPKVNAHNLVGEISKATLIVNGRDVPLMQYLFDNAQLLRFLDRALMTVLGDTWPKSDKNLTEVPWPLSRPGAPLHYGEYYTFHEVRFTANALVNKMALKKREGLKALYERMRKGDEKSVIEYLKKGFMETVKEAKFYVEGADLNWKLPLGGEKLNNHPRYNLPSLNKRQEKILKEHQLLWCLRCDVLNDKYLSDHWPVQEENNTGDQR